MAEDEDPVEVPIDGTLDLHAFRPEEVGDLVPEWLDACRAVRAWAVANPHEYALVYGSPVPGYRAPPDTVPAANP